MELQCRVLQQDHVRWISHFSCPVGQDPPFCLLSTDRRYVFLPPMLHCLIWSGPLVSLQQMVLFGQNPSQGTLLKASQFLAGALIPLIYHHHTYTTGRIRGTSCAFGSSCQGTGRTASQSQHCALHQQSKELVCPVFRSNGPESPFLLTYTC